MSSGRATAANTPSLYQKSADGYTSILTEFCDALDGKGPVPTTAEDGLMNLRIILAAYEASRTGSVIKL